MEGQVKYFCGSFDAKANMIMTPEELGNVQLRYKLEAFEQSRQAGAKIIKICNSSFDLSQNNILESFLLLLKMD